MHSRVQCSLSCLLHCVLQWLGDLNCQLFDAHSKPSRSFKVIALFARGAATKHKNNSLLRLLLMSCYISEPLQGVVLFLRVCLLLECSFLPCSSQLLQYGHAYQLKDHTNVKMTDVRMYILQTHYNTLLCSRNHSSGKVWLILPLAYQSLPPSLLTNGALVLLILRKSFMIVATGRTQHINLPTGPTNWQSNFYIIFSCWFRPFTSHGSQNQQHN